MLATGIHRGAPPHQPRRLLTSAAGIAALATPAVPRLPRAGEASLSRRPRRGHSTHPPPIVLPPPPPPPAKPQTAHPLPPLPPRVAASVVKEPRQSALWTTRPVAAVAAEPPDGDPAGWWQGTTPVAVRVPMVVEGPLAEGAVSRAAAAAPSLPPPPPQPPSSPQMGTPRKVAEWSPTGVATTSPSSAAAAKAVRKETIPSGQLPEVAVAVATGSLAGLR